MTDRQILATVIAIILIPILTLAAAFYFHPDPYNSYWVGFGLGILPLISLWGLVMLADYPPIRKFFRIGR